MKLDKEIENLNHMIIQMGDLVESNLENALSLYENYEEEKAALINDDIVDLHERLVEETCMNILLKERPFAKDMRLVLGALKLVEDLERLGDHAEDVVIFSKRLKKEKIVQLPRMKVMMKETLLMVHQAILSYIQKDALLAEQTIKKDDVIDRLYEELLDEVKEKMDKNQVSSSFAIYTTLIIKYMERIADHASNIAEWVIYILYGYHKDRQIF